MAVSTDDIRKRYPLPVYNYKVAILWKELTTGIPTSNDTLDKMTVISCTEVSGLQMVLDTVTYRDGLSFIAGYHILPTIAKEVNLSIRKGVTQYGEYLSNWMKMSYPNSLPRSSNLRKRDLLIDLCNEEGIPLVRWTVRKAMPIKLEAPTFNAETNEMAFEKMDLIAHELQVEYFKSEV